MIFSLDVRRARKGDCLLLHYGTGDKPGLALIDGGPKQVYDPHLKPRLMEIREARELEDQQPLRIDLLMVSHVDDDHIQGILDLTRELGEQAGTPFVKIARLWHNSFDEVIGKDPKELTQTVTAQFGAAALEGEFDEDAAAALEHDDPAAAADTMKVLASIPQGHRLRLDAEALEIPRNPEFDGKLILAAADPLTLPRGLALTVAGPRQPELKALQKQHDDWLKRLEEEGLTPREALAAYVDRSVPNLSSLVVLAEVDGKTMLLTGDARGDKVLKGLKEVGLLKDGETLHVDLLKVPHHGSSNNVETEFFERITADHYVFSGDGEHGNPERETLEMLLDARGTAPFTLHFTYPVDEVDTGRREDWEKQKASVVKANKKRKAEGKPLKPVPDDWSPSQQSLAALLEERPLSAGQTLEAVPKKKPHVIDLLDPLGF
jgi:hypothetical protein